MKNIDIINNSGAIIFKCEVSDECNLVYISENVKQLGYSIADFLSHKINYKSIINDSDIDAFLFSLDENLKSSNNNFSMFHRVKAADGTLRCLDIKCIVERDERGVAKFLYGTLNDVTNLVRQENKLKLLAQALELSDDLVYITDHNGVITYVNESMVRHSGYDKKELLGRTAAFFNSSKNNEEYFDEMWDALSAGNNYNHIITNRNKNGEFYYIDANFVPVNDYSTKTRNYVITAKDVTKEVKENRKNEELNSVDKLTNLHNKHKTTLDIEVFMARSKRYNLPFSIAKFNVDDFHKVNDKYGNYVGDSVLKDLTRIIRANIREVDLLGRWDGDEFMLLLDNAEIDEAVKVVDKIRAIIANSIFGGHWKIRVSAGVAQYHTSEESKFLIKRAERALYEAKSEGKNQVAFK